MGFLELASLVFPAWIAYRSGIPGVSRKPTRWPAEPTTQAEMFESLDPSFAPSVLRLFVRLRSRGFRPVALSAWRNLNTQARLKAQGASTVSFSFHNATLDDEPAALAIDVGDRSGRPIEEFHAALGEESHLLGLFWGGDWHTFVDPGHVQGVPNSALREVWARSLH